MSDDAFMTSEGLMERGSLDAPNGGNFSSGFVYSEAKDWIKGSTV
jgi:hypothetical protein